MRSWIYMVSKICISYKERGGARAAEAAVHAGLV